MVDLFKYLTQHHKASSLPSYHDMRECVDYEREVDEEDPGLEELFVVPESRDEFHQAVRQVASHLWGGEAHPPELFQNLSVVSVHEYTYADHKPLRIEVMLPGAVTHTFYAKPFNERRLYGLELEHLLSPYKYDYSVSGEAIFEDHIMGTDAKDFMEAYRGYPYRNPDFAEEMLRLDFRTRAFLLGDMHDQNYIISQVESGDERAFVARPIDFDKLFLIRDLEGAGVISTKDRESVTELLGKGRCESVIGFERERMKRRFYENKARIRDLFNLIGQSQDCSSSLPDLSMSLAQHYGSQDLYDADSMGELFRGHLRRVLQL